MRAVRFPGLSCPVLRPQDGVGVQVEPLDKVQTLKDQVDGVKNIMTENVERILARGERLDELMDKSEDLQAGVSHLFNNTQTGRLCRADPGRSGFSSQGLTWRFRNAEQPDQVGVAADTCRGGRSQPAS